MNAKTKKVLKTTGLILLGAGIAVGTIYGIKYRNEIGAWCGDTWRKAKGGCGNCGEANNDSECSCNNEVPQASTETKVEEPQTTQEAPAQQPQYNKNRRWRGHYRGPRIAA